MDFSLGQINTDISRPLLGTWIAQNKSWQWAEFAIAMVTAPLLILTVLMRETCAWRISQKSGHAAPDDTPEAEVEKGSPKKAVLNMLRVVFTDPSIIILGLWMGVIMGIQFSFYSALPQQLRGAYQLDWLPQTLCFFSLGLGSILGLLVHFIFETQALSTLATHWHSRYAAGSSSSPASRLPARYRLLTALPVTIVLPMVVIFFAFTVLPDSSVFISLSLLVLYSACSAMAFLSGMIYLIEIFSTVEDAILVAGYFFVVHLTSAGIVVASGSGMGNLGFKAAFGVFAAAAAMLGLFVWGLWIRNRYLERRLQ
jgi:hypothetical protein